jgi:hypothetical protein
MGLNELITQSSDYTGRFNETCCYLLYRFPLTPRDVIKARLSLGIDTPERLSLWIDRGKEFIMPLSFPQDDMPLFWAAVASDKDEIFESRWKGNHAEGLALAENTLMRIAQEAITLPRDVMERNKQALVDLFKRSSFYVEPVPEAEKLPPMQRRFNYDRPTPPPEGQIAKIIAL